MKVFRGLTPGTTTLEEVLRTYDYPKYIINDRYFYYEMRNTYRGWDDREDVFIEFRRSKKLGKPRYLGDLDLTAVVSKVFVYSDYRMGELATYIDQIISITPYPYSVFYEPIKDYFILVFPNQGYAMYFDGEEKRLIAEAYFEPKIWKSSEYLKIRNPGFEFRKFKKELIPKFLP